MIAVEQQLRQAIKDFDEAAMRGDVAKIETLIADQYFHTDIVGKIQNKATWLEEYLKPIAAQLKAGEMQWEVYFSDDIQVHAYGDDLAVAIGRWNLKRNSDRQILVGRFTHVWRKQPSGWQRVAYQATVISQKK